MRVVAFLAVALSMVAASASAQIRVQAGGADVSIGNGGINVQTDEASGATATSKASAAGGNTAGNTIGGIEGEVDSQGVTIINGRVYIDGKEIPPKVTRYRSPRTGEVYVIRRKGGSVEVTSEQEGGK